MLLFLLFTYSKFSYKKLFFEEKKYFDVYDRIHFQKENIGNFLFYIVDQNQILYNFLNKNMILKKHKKFSSKHARLFLIKLRSDKNISDYSNLKKFYSSCVFHYKNFFAEKDIFSEYFEKISIQRTGEKNSLKILADVVDEENLIWALYGSHFDIPCLDKEDKYLLVFHDIINFKNINYRNLRLYELNWKSDTKTPLVDSILNYFKKESKDSNYKLFLGKEVLNFFDPLMDDSMFVHW